MKQLKKTVAVAVVGMMLTGCGIYNKYEQKVETPADAFGADESIKEASGETSIAQMSWREFFTDPKLQQLIEQVLANNTDLNSARIAIEKSQAALTAAKLAYLPTLAFAPQGTLSSFAAGTDAARCHTLQPRIHNGTAVLHAAGARQAA